MCKKRIILSAVSIFFTFVLGFQAPVLAGNSLLDQGSSLIKSLDKSGKGIVCRCHFPDVL